MTFIFRVLYILHHPSINQINLSDTRLDHFTPKERENLTTPGVQSEQQNSPRGFHVFLLPPPKPRRCRLSPTTPLISKEQKILQLLHTSQSYVRTTNKSVKRQWILQVLLTVSDCFLLTFTSHLLWVSAFPVLAALSFFAALETALGGHLCTQEST